MRQLLVGGVVSACNIVVHAPRIGAMAFARATESSWRALFMAGSFAAAGTLGNHFPLVLCHSREHVDCEAGCLEHITAHKVVLAVHKVLNERYLRASRSSFANDQLGLVLLAGGAAKRAAIPAGASPADIGVQLTS